MHVNDINILRARQGSVCFAMISALLFIYREKRHDALIFCL